MLFRLTGLKQFIFPHSLHKITNMTTVLINTEINRNGNDPITISLSIDKGFCNVRVYTNNPEKFNPEINKDVYGGTQKELIKNGYKVYAALVRKYTKEYFNL